VAGLTPLDPFLVVGLWVWAMWGATMRTWRTVALLAVVTGGYLLSTQPPALVSVALRAGLLTAAVWLLLFHTAVFSALPANQLEFNEAYRALLNEGAALARRYRPGRVDTRTFGSRLSDLLKRLERLQAPTDDWAALQKGTADYLRRQLIAFERSSGESVPGDGSDELKQLRDEYDRVVTAAKEIR